MIDTATEVTSALRRTDQIVGGLGLGFNEVPKEVQPPAPAQVPVEAPAEMSAQPLVQAETSSPAVESTRPDVQPVADLLQKRAQEGTAGTPPLSSEPVKTTVTPRSNVAAVAKDQAQSPVEEIAKGGFLKRLLKR